MIKAMKKLLFVSTCAITMILSGCSSDDSNDNVNNPSQCDIAADAALDAKAAYEAANEEDFADACTDYKTALQVQKQVCGDANGSIQDKIDSLGDCTAPVESNGIITVTAGTLPIEFSVISIVEQGEILKVSGETEQGNYTIYFEVEKNVTGENVVQNFEMKLISVYYPYEGEFDTNIDVNENGELSGSFSGIVMNDDNGATNLYNGNIDLTY